MIENEEGQGILIPLGILQARLVDDEGARSAYYVVTDATDPEVVVARFGSEEVGSFLATLCMADAGFPRKQKWYSGFCKGFVRKGMLGEYLFGA